MSPVDVVLRGGVWTTRRAAEKSKCGVKRARRELQTAADKGLICRVGGPGGGWSAEMPPDWGAPCDLAVERTVDAIDAIERSGGRATWDGLAARLHVHRTTLRPVMAWLRSAGMILTQPGRYGGVELA